MVDVDEPLIVRYDLRIAAGIIHECRALPCRPSRSTAGIDVVGPELIPLLKRLAISRKVTRKRERDANFDWPGGLCRRASTASRHNHKGHAEQSNDTKGSTQ